MVVDYVLAMWMDGFQGHFQKSFLTFYVLEKLDYRSDPFNTLIPYMSNVYSIQIIYCVYSIQITYAYGIWNSSQHFASKHDPLISLPHPMHPARPGWIRHCHSGTMERRRVSGGHHASRAKDGEGG